MVAAGVGGDDKSVVSRDERWVGTAVKLEAHVEVHDELCTVRAAGHLCEAHGGLPVVCFVKTHAGCRKTLCGIKFFVMEATDVKQWVFPSSFPEIGCISSTSIIVHVYNKSDTACQEYSN